MALRGKQARHLRSLAHHLKPVVLIGSAGISDAVLSKVDAELENHELIKVKVQEGAPLSAKEAAPELENKVSGRPQVAQVIGRTIVLYRARKEDPEIVLPS
jgi:RNA-binding protein